ncbi:MAG: SDR family NAD(P)-dependent oxidoreductase [Syntrophothermus sp.]
MNKFAFLVHPLKPQDITKKVKILGKLPDKTIEGILAMWPPFKAGHATGIRSKTGAEIEGWFIALPRTPRQLMEMPVEKAYREIIQAGRLAERLGAQIFGLGAFTKVVGDAGVTVARNLSIPVTTGNSYTAYTSIEGARVAAQKMGIDFKTAKVAVIGATGAIGSVISRILAKDGISHLTLVAREQEKLEALAKVIRAQGDPHESSNLNVAVSTDINRAVSEADVVFTVTSAIGGLIDPQYLKPGAVLCDAARPRNVAKEVVEKRKDVLVIEGGVVEMPGKEATAGMNIGLPPKMVLACMAETMVLTLEGRFESYTLGRDLDMEKVEETGRLAAKHGFKLGGLRSFDAQLSEEDIARVKESARRTPATGKTRADAKYPASKTGESLATT